VAKAGLILWNLASRLEAAPFQNSLQDCIFPQAVEALRRPESGVEQIVKPVVASAARPMPRLFQNHV
jgi:hypothetical protein